MLRSSVALVCSHRECSFNVRGGDQIKRQLETRISSEAYANWVSRTTFRAADGDMLVVAAPVVFWAFTRPLSYLFREMFKRFSNRFSRTP